MQSTSTAYSAYLVAQAHRWPPQFPPQRTLLTDHGTPELDVPADRAAWTADHWRAYAQFLEQQGARLTGKLRDAQADRLRAVSPALQARTRKAIAALYPAPKRLGRPKGSKYDAIALEALEAQSMARSAGRRLTDREALAAAYLARGQRASRATASSARTIVNRIVALRKGNHENPAGMHTQ